jgi:hypothetical protein
LSFSITAVKKGVEPLGRKGSVADDESAGLVNSSWKVKETVYRLQSMKAAATESDVAQENAAASE